MITLVNELGDDIEILAKVDTGAYTGGLHVENIEEKNGTLTFQPVSELAPVFSTKHYRKKWVKPSTGEKQTRYVVGIPVRIEGVNSEIEVTLTDRSEMKYELLLGRKNLKHKFLVDVSL